MSKIYWLLFGGILTIVLGYFVLGYVSSHTGWYGYKKWQYRIATSNIEESKRRGVFVKELHYQIDNFSGTLVNFRPYIEKGFKYGYHSSRETVPLTNSNYLYQLSFNLHPSEKIGLLINQDQLKKFDSSGIIRGYLKYPNLSDTIIVNITGENINSGTIKVWQ